VGAAEVFDHSPWDGVLKKHVNAIGEVDYAALKRDRSGLDLYVRMLADTSPESRQDLFPSREHELAYWLNAYNALVTKGVVDGYPVESVRDLGLLWSFFRRADYVVAGKRISLNTIEHEIIRRRYQDPRIHFALVCASLSCPRLAREAFQGERLDDQLDSLVKQFLAERRNLAADQSRNEIWLSKLLDWYAKDFEHPKGNDTGPKTVLEFVRAYAPEAERKKIAGMKNPRLRYRDYDWSINAPGSRAKAKSEYERELAAGAAR